MISIIACIGFAFLDLLHVLNAARYSFKLSLHIPLWMDSQAILAKRQIAHILTEMIMEGYISMDLAIDIAKALLYENAERIYKKL